MDKSPDAFRTISEVADHLETPAHVLRFWESRFPQIRPVKRAGGRRYYRPADVALLTGIKRLLHEEGLTIRGVQKILREQGVRHVAGLTEAVAAEEDQDAEAALEAALNANFSATGSVSEKGASKSPVPQAEVETAQVVALETALRRQPAPTKPAQPSLFSDDFEAAAPVKPPTPPVPLRPAPPQVEVEDIKPTEVPVHIETEESVWLLPDAPEAPMHEDAEPEAAVAALFATSAAAPDETSTEQETMPNQIVADSEVPEIESAARAPAQDQSALTMEDGDLLTRLRALPQGALFAHAETVRPLLGRLEALRERLKAPVLAAS